MQRTARVRAHGMSAARIERARALGFGLVSTRFRRRLYGRAHPRSAVSACALGGYGGGTPSSIGRLTRSQISCAAGFGPWRSSYRDTSPGGARRAARRRRCRSVCAWLPCGRGASEPMFRDIGPKDGATPPASRGHGVVCAEHATVITPHGLRWSDPVRTPAESVTPLRYHSQSCREMCQS